MNEFDKTNKGALWMKISEKNNKPYISGYINVEGKDYKIVLFKNDKYKEGDKFPLYNAVINVDEDGKVYKTKPREKPVVKAVDDELPF